MIEAAEDWRAKNSADSQLIIAIGSSNRPQNLRNPWSSEERGQMAEAWLDYVGISAIIVHIPDIQDPPNWVSHAESYHGGPGTLFTSDVTSADLYQSSGWDVVMGELERREEFEGWKVRETARMLSTVSDIDAVSSVLGASVPGPVVSLLVENDMIRRLAFMGEGGEPVG
tara:strand:- start:116 stop:625 length:510 start_codon:yes stop_codon:yes gene_type:complete